MSVASRVFHLSWALVSFAAWRPAAVLAVFVPGLAMATPVPVTVTITSVECTQNDECDAARIEAAGEVVAGLRRQDLHQRGGDADQPRAG